MDFSGGLVARHGLHHREFGNGEVSEVGEEKQFATAVRVVQFDG